MQNQEIKKALTEYATEDTNIAKENGSMAITGTKIGVITLNFNNGWFIALNNMAVELTGTCTQQEMIDWLIDQYEVVEA